MAIQKTFAQYAADAKALRRSFNSWKVEGAISKRKGKLSGADYRTARHVWTEQIRSNADKGLEQYMLENSLAAQIIKAVVTEDRRLPHKIADEIGSSVFDGDLQKVRGDIASLYGSQSSPIQPYSRNNGKRGKLRGIILHGDDKMRESVRAIVKRVETGVKSAP